MNKKDSLRALCYRLRARHGRTLYFEYILPIESGDGDIPRMDRVMLIAILALWPMKPIDSAPAHFEIDLRDCSCHRSTLT
jgi:hypothetical protein